MKHLHEKNEQFAYPDESILDTFTNPGVRRVILQQKEFTSVCPLTHQPDYCTVTITYTPNELCVESKSLKLYLAAYRQVGAFAETLAAQIGRDLERVLKPKTLSVILYANPRGGIDITAAYEMEG